MKNVPEWRAAAWLVALVPCLIAAPVAGQEPGRATIDSLRAEMARLQAQLDSLRRQVGNAAPAADSAEDALARIRRAAAAALAQDTVASPEPQVAEGDFVGRQRNLNVFNPEISVTGDVLAFVDSRGGNGDNFVPREFELALQSNLDPYSRAKIFVAHHQHGGGAEPFHEEGGDEEEEGHGEGAETEIEEGYVEWVNLPGGLGLTLGKFRQRFGRLNRWHPHSLPAQQLPLPYLAFLGEEGLAQTGMSMHWLVPVHGAGTYEVWTQLTRSSQELLFGESNRLSALGHVNAFWQLSDATYFELGASGLIGPYAGEEFAESWGTRVYGLDATLDWTPPARAKFRSLNLHGGIAWADHHTGIAPASKAFGAFVIGEYRLGQQWIAGARWEFTENPFAPEESATLFGPSLTWWQSEYVRIRASYEVLDRPEDRFGRFVLQTTFAMGPHKHETY